MNPEYALLILKEEKQKLEDKITEMNLLEAEGEKINKRERTKYMHQLGSLEFTIEVLEEYLD
ncbi:hypothetical protein [Bacillus smithii]|uniref:hypothetical protein n=1 Tax=Bacillus smithii TaxID=1479 RepID=UPI003D21D66F